MNVASAIQAVEETQEEADSVSGASRLSGMERIFCDVFMSNGGNGSAAAVAAGYPEASSTVQACRLLCRKRVADYIIASSQRLIQAALPVAIRALIVIAGDEQAQRKDRIKAATSLLEHGGMAAPKGGVQVNVGVAVNGQQAQQLISSVWDAKERRLSDIPPAMPDKELKQIEQSLDALAERIPDRPGGGELQGPSAGTCPLPGYSSAPTPKSDVSCECDLCRGKKAPADDGFGAFNG